MEKAGVGGGGVESAILLCPAPLLALALLRGMQRLDGWGITDTWLELGAAGVDHVGAGGAGY